MKPEKPAEYSSRETVLKGARMLLAASCMSLRITRAVSRYVLQRVHDTLVANTSDTTDQRMKRAGAWFEPF